MANRELFGTDGVRGLAGQYPLDDAGTISIGRAIGTFFARDGEQIVLGWDPRASSKTIVDNLVKGLNSVGVNVTLAGVLPTPGLAYLTRQNDQFVAGVMVTASHNPVEYNGVKAFDDNGDKLPDSTEATLNELIVNGVDDRGHGTVDQDTSLIQDYEDFLVNSAAGFDLAGLKIGIDSANGAASGLAERVFKRLSAEVTAYFDQPDGRNINAACGATDTAALAQNVKNSGLDVGVALDGDADRLVMVDGKGREVKGDHIMYILAVGQNLPGLVATVMSNQGFETSLTKRGIKVYRTAVGDRYVLEGLAQTGYQLGGEQSGHIILPQLLKTGDALLAAVQTLKIVSQSGKSLADWRDEVQLLPQAIVNIPLSDKRVLQKDSITQYIDSQAAALSDGRLLIRPSGTEPLARIMVESPNAEAESQRIANELQTLIEQEAKS